MRLKTILLSAVLAAAPAAFPSSACAWEWLRSANSNVEKGNQKMQDKSYQEALKSYNKAARELPESAGVQLNRGLALTAKGEAGKAREAFLRAAEPPAPDKVRADAYYNMGVTFYREADGKAGKQDHEQAQKLFREAADSFKRSLRITPKNRDAAWNLELALRRIVEEKKKQEQKEKEQEQKEKQQEQQQDQQQQDQQQQDQQQQDQQQQDQQQQDQQQQEQQQDQQQQQKEKQQQEQKKQEKKTEPQQPQADKERKLPKDVARALDALQDSEENLERHRARIRAARERRRIEKDW